MTIDFRVMPPTKEVFAFFTDIPPHLKRYSEVYSKAWKEAPALIMPIPKFVEYLDDAGIDKAVLVAGPTPRVTGETPNEHIAKIVKEYPDKFLGLAGVNPSRKSRAVEDLRTALGRLGLSGLTLGPYLINLYANDRRLYPLYEECNRRGVPVVLHTSVSFNSDAPLDLGRPTYLDAVAVDFPDLKIVASHAGWPWVDELVAVAWRHRNVYLEISAIRPRYLGTPGTGWEPLIRYGSTILQDKVLFATEWPMIDIKTALTEIGGLGLGDDIREKWLHRNAEVVLGLK